MAWTRRPLFAHLILVFATLAMAATSLGHRSGENTYSPELLAYIDLGGALEDICGDTIPSHGFGHTCDACLIGKNILLPDAGPSIAKPLTTGRALGFVAPSHLPCTKRPDGNQHARAPPSLMVA